MIRLTLLTALLLPTAQDDDLLRRIGVKRGICALVGVSSDSQPVDLAKASELVFYVQVTDEARAAALRRAADRAGLLGRRVYVDRGKPERIHLAENLADAVVALDAAPREEILRVLRPGGKAIRGGEEFTKPAAEGADDWRHPYHGPDNNPQSKDQLARRPYLTHFMAEPWYASMPQMTVASGGRIFKVFGNRTSAQPQWPVMNTLLCLSAWNGTVLWKRPLAENFMFHRNTLVATPDTLYLADDASCKRIDPATGETRDEIVAPAELADGPVWKWMAFEGGVLYALVGEKEESLKEVRAARLRGAGWPWWKIPGYAFGFGRTVLAIDPATKKVLWHFRSEHPLDGRGMSLAAGRVFVYSHKNFLAALDAKTGKTLWKNLDEKVAAAVGEHDAAQHWMKGFASTAYVKASADALYFAGPTRTTIVAVSAKDGSLLWQRPGGNSHLVLRPEGLYALGEGRINSASSSFKLDPLTGEVLAEFPSRDRCTRATGSADSIFTRGGQGGSTAVFDVTSEKPRLGVVSPMRPSCEDGVVVSNGHLFWGPWMCRCDDTQIGVISLGPGGDFEYGAEARESERLESSPAAAQPLPVTAEDWPTYRKDNARSCATSREVPPDVARRWEYAPPAPCLATAPVAAAGWVFVGGSDGTVRALDAADGTPRWSAHTGGALRYPPALWEGRLYAGSGDGWVYCFEAATGKRLWRFRAAPVERRIPVFGELLSTWPVGSGVLVDDGVVYAAAGNANFDGTHVYALDARTGKIRWQNNESGHLYAERPDSGAGVQGHLLLYKGGLYLPGGSLARLARYDLADGKFGRADGGGGKDLYVSEGAVRGSGVHLYWRPDDSHYIAAARVPGPAGEIAVAMDHLGPVVKGGDPKKPKLAWTGRPFHENAAVAVGKNAVVVAGIDREGGKVTAGLAALSLEDGKTLWRYGLPAAPVSFGLAIDRDGQIVVSLRDGRVIGVVAKP